MWQDTSRKVFLRFSDVFMSYRKDALGTNGLMGEKYLQNRV